MKVGKEEVAGLLEAIRIFLEEDHEERCRRDSARLALIAEAVEGRHGVCATLPAPGAFAPRLTIDVDPATAGFTVWQLLRLLQERELPVHLNEARAWEGKAIIDARPLLDGDEQLVCAALEETLDLLEAGL